MKEIPKAAASVSVEDLEGNRRKLETLWSQEPVVLVFLRHFG